MTGYHEALQLILSKAAVQETEEIDLSCTLNRVLAADVHSDIDLPPFDKSAMDGYACRREDIEAELTIVETLPAGKKPEKSIGPKECARIMTGAVIPEGADMVFMQENAEIQANGKVQCNHPNGKANICYRGEDVQTGNRILPAHTLIRPKHLPSLAGAGMTKVRVFRQPRVALFSTGTELVEPDLKPAPHQIRNTNSIQLTGQLAAMNIHAHYGGILKDEHRIIENQILQAFNDHELLILTGGVSVGTYDLIPALLEQAGFDIIVRKTAIQPGKPMIFGVRENRFCFGLSGNPVSSFIQFELYVKPFIYRFMGHSYEPGRYQLPLKNDLSRKKTDRLQFKPARIEGSQVEPVEFHGSAHINSLADADCLIEIPVGTSHLQKGKLATIRIIE